MNNKKIKKVIATAVAATLGATVMVGFAATPATAATDIKIGILTINSMGSLKYAVDQGIMKKNGLNVTELIQFPAPPPSIAALASGAIQFTYAPSIAVINAYANAGIALKVVAPADGYSVADLARAKRSAAFAALVDDTAVCVNPASNIKRWKELEGKTVSVPARKTQAEVTIANAVRKDGGNPAYINWVTIGFPEVVPSVQNNKVAAGFTVEPFSGACKTAGMKILGYPGVAFFDKEQATGLWVTTATFAAANPAAVTAFQKSIFESNSFAMRSKANMDKILQAATTVTGQSLTVTKQANPPYYPLAVTKIDIQGPADKMLALGFLTKKIDVGGLLLRQYR